MDASEQVKPADAVGSSEGLGLVERLRQHAEFHDGIDPHDDVRAQWAADLRRAASALEKWRDAYLAFKGAFDTPQMRRQLSDDYSQDARRRMREINEAFEA